MKQHARDIFYGIIVGVANIIPGVSGGTMALVLGFYERLIGAINNISATTIVTMIKALSFKKKNLEAFRVEYNKIEGPFLIKLMAGALLAIGALAKLMSYLLENQHDPTYGFFFGLVLVSAYTPWSLIKKKTLPAIIAIAIAAAGIIAVSEIMSDADIIRKAEARQQVTEQTGIAHAFTGEDVSIGKYVFYFASGAIAISAMILPGISGSFVLLLMGGYFDILRAVATFNFPILGVFAFGCLGGIIVFTRFLNYLLRRFYDPTLGFLLGLVVGSLWVIWPFKHSVMVGSQLVHLSNRLPGAAGLNEIATLGAFIAGAVIVVIMIVIERQSGKA